MVRGRSDRCVRCEGRGREGDAGGGPCQERLGAPPPPLPCLSGSPHGLTTKETPRSQGQVDASHAAAEAERPREVPAGRCGPPGAAADVADETPLGSPGDAAASSCAAAGLAAVGPAVVAEAAFVGRSTRSGEAAVERPPSDEVGAAEAAAAPASCEVLPGGEGEKQSESPSLHVEVGPPPHCVGRPGGGHSAELLRRGRERGPLRDSRPTLEARRAPAPPARCRATERRCSRAPHPSCVPSQARWV